jgi:hypothetical protein
MPALTMDPTTVPVRTTIESFWWASVAMMNFQLRHIICPVLLAAPLNDGVETAVTLRRRHVPLAQSGSWMSRHACQPPFLSHRRIPLGTIVVPALDLHFLLVP